MNTLIGFIAMAVVSCAILGRKNGFFLTFLAIAFYFLTKDIPLNIKFAALGSVVFLIIWMIVKYFMKASKEKKNPSKNLDTAFHPSLISPIVSEHTFEMQGSATNLSLNVKKNEDQVFQISGIQFGSLHSFLSSIAQITRHQHQLPHVLKDKINNREFHLVFLKHGIHFDSIIVKVIDEGLSVQSEKSLIDLPDVFKKVRFDGEMFAIKY